MMSGRRWIGPSRRWGRPLRTDQPVRDPKAVDRQIDRARAAITEAMSQADIRRQADALDKLIASMTSWLVPDQPEAEHERLRQVIDEIVRLAPTAVTG